jgi:UDP-N-acetylmuramate dehydrogenase
MSGGAEGPRGRGAEEQRDFSATQPPSRTVAHFIQTAASALGIVVTANEPLARHTTFRIGGPADLYAVASTVEQLERLAALAAKHGIPTTILGGGSNVLVSDAGVRGVVIANQTRNWVLGIRESVLDSLQASIPNTQYPIPNTRLIADSGVALAGLARTAIKAGWSGLEWAVSVPGTVGGAVIGNAGAHGADIASNLAWALVAYPGQGRQMLTGQQMAFAYRSSLLKRQLATGEDHPVVLAAAFDLIPGDVAEITARADAFLARRRASQPVEPSAGSIFRNPTGDHAGRLVEAAGLKGHRVGGAQISPRHANFIVNTGDATAGDVIALMNLVRRRVYENAGVELEPEILFLGEWDEPLSVL